MCLCVSPSVYAHACTQKHANSPSESAWRCTMIEQHIHILLVPFSHRRSLSSSSLSLPENACFLTDFQYTEYIHSLSMFCEVKQRGLFSCTVNIQVHWMLMLFSCIILQTGTGGFLMLLSCAGWESNDARRCCCSLAYLSEVGRHVIIQNTAIFCWVLRLLKENILFILLNL